jgi:hypothetical protein
LPRTIIIYRELGIASRNVHLWQAYIPRSFVSKSKEKGRVDGFPLWEEAARSIHEQLACTCSGVQLFLLE